MRHRARGARRTSRELSAAGLGIVAVARHRSTVGPHEMGGNTGVVAVTPVEYCLCGTSIPATDHPGTDRTEGTT
jgi:hypothetical protein